MQLNCWWLWVGGGHWSSWGEEGKYTGDGCDAVFTYMGNHY